MTGNTAQFQVRSNVGPKEGENERTLSTIKVDSSETSFPYLLGYVRSQLIERTPDTRSSLRYRDLLPEEMDLATTDRGTTDRPTERRSTSIPKVLLPPDVPDVSELVGEWEGKVESVSASTFTAVLVDLKRRRTDEIAEFGLDEISADDQILIAPGALFFWTITRHLRRDGRKEQVSELRFRRIISSLSPAQSAEVEKWAEDAAALFDQPTGSG